MSPESTRGWDPRIRPWVRHPNVDAPSESLCYQVFPAETVALAWRYRDREAAEREDGARGRPLVSRVLVSPARLLPPQLAIMLCRVGLPGLAAARAGRLDQSAAQEKGLQQVVAAALSDPHTPLAIQLRDPYIFHGPRVAPQALLLWGLWRTVGPLLARGTARRGWSFSTFELPMGSQDASTLPDIVFRLAQAASGPPVNARQEIRVRPGDPSAAAGASPYLAELAEWLVSEYRETNGDQLEQLIIGCSAGQPLDARLQIVFDLLRAKWSPVSVSGPAAPFVPVPSGHEPVPRPAGPDEAAAPEHWDVSGYQQGAEHREVSGRRATIDYWEVDQPPDAHDYREAGQPRNAAGHREPPGYRDVPQEPGPDAYGDPDSAYPAASAQAPPPSVAGLLARLESEPDSQVFRSILHDLLSARTSFEERVAVRSQLPRSNWFIPALERHGHRDFVPDLAGIIRVFVLPDLERPSVASALSGWVRKGPPEVTAALLTASKAADQERRSDRETFRLMTAALGEAALYKLLEVSGIPFDWPRPRRETKPERQSDRGFFARIFGALGLRDDYSPDLPLLPAPW